MTKCERCKESLPAQSYDLLDYCGVCGKNLCPKCMKNGCCGNKPAKSGMQADYGEEKADASQSRR